MLLNIDMDYVWKTTALFKKDKDKTDPGNDEMKINQKG